MTYLLLSIISFTAMMLIFKLIDKFNANTFQVIVFNYITAAVLGFTVMGAGLSLEHITQSIWFPNAVVIGITFISLFYLIAITAQKVGISVSTVANKMSVIIPVIFAFFLYDDTITFLKISGIVLALLGVLMATSKQRAYSEDEVESNKGKKVSGFDLFHREKNYLNEKNEGVDKKYLYMPIALFIGSGLLDTYINYTEKFYLRDTGASLDFIPTVFSVAGIAGGLILIGKIILSPKIFSIKNLLWGLILGFFNYTSLYFFLESLKIGNLESSVVFTINNIGIVSLSTITSFVFFKEYLSNLNKTGVVVCLMAIILIAFS
ncbi:MAG: EamA/RhaT family transporter [Bacteroidetes bacterium]|nr:EamA/RhaT family transporter [Bacteroidota bacterium]HET6244276.1 EamA/RhaT family transporter [Bacteroidia bacterium]